MIVYKNEVRRKDPNVLAGVLPVDVLLAESVLRVKAGTPLRPGPKGWVVAKDGLGEVVAADGRYGGELVKGYRSAVLDLHERDFVPGMRLRVSGVDDNGLVEFAHDPTGPFVAATEHTVLLDMASAKLHVVTQLLTQALIKPEA